MGLFITRLWESPSEFFLISLVVIFSICLHEYCHAQCALWMGDSTAADQGHLTLNPLKQMGPVSIIMFLVAGIAWGAVPVNPARLRSRYSWGPLAVSLAGPAANLCLAFLGWCSFGLLAARRLAEEGSISLQESNVLLLLLLLGVYNIILLIFNLLPAPGLDGWNALTHLFPKLQRTSSEFLKGSMVFLIFAAMMGISYLFDFAYYLMVQAVKVFE